MIYLTFYKIYDIFDNLARVVKDGWISLAPSVEWGLVQVLNWEFLPGVTI